MFPVPRVGRPAPTKRTDWGTPPDWASATVLPKTDVVCRYSKSCSPIIASTIAPIVSIAAATTLLQIQKTLLTTWHKLLTFAVDNNYFLSIVSQKKNVTLQSVLKFTNMLLVISNCHGSYCWDWTISLGESLTFVVAIAALFFTLKQHLQARKWKKADFILSFYNNTYMSPQRSYNVKRGELMLDWNRMDIPLQEGEIEGKRKFWFDDKLLRSSLKIHFDMKDTEGFSDEESIVRLVMDDFLGALGSCYSFIEKRLITKNDLSNDVLYYINIIGDETNKSKDSETRNSIWQYIIRYGYHDVIRLCKIFGYNLVIKK